MPLHTALRCRRRCRRRPAIKTPALLELYLHGLWPAGVNATAASAAANAAVPPVTANRGGNLSPEMSNQPRVARPAPLRTVLTPPEPGVPCPRWNKIGVARSGGLLRRNARRSALFSRCR